MCARKPEKISEKMKETFFFRFGRVKVAIRDGDKKMDHSLDLN